MIRQRPYRPPGANPDRGIQIDCGIYFFLMVLIYREDLSLSILTPSTVHQFRSYLALCILNPTFPLNILDIVKPSTVLQQGISLCAETTDNDIQLRVSEVHHGTSDQFLVKITKIRAPSPSTPARIPSRAIIYVGKYSV